MQREHQPDAYEHVKSHGGKKSQLSAFLEEVCKDVEARLGRGQPILEKPEEASNAEKKAEEKPAKAEEKEKEKKGMLLRTIPF